MAKNVDQQFQSDAHALKEAISKAVAQFMAKHGDHAVKVKFDSEAEKPGVDLDIKQRATQEYHSRAGVTRPLGKAAAEAVGVPAE